ncbi:MAG TPA: hypothetical protein VFU69_03900 [Ktedonobacterales bacterium]|nr:hypothetical protein [Ktedonobacterales bacterium]
MPYDDEPVHIEEAARLKNLDEQIDQRLRGHMRAQAQPDSQDALDPNLLKDLQNVYQPRAQAFRSGLDRVWGRLEQRGVTSTQQPRQQGDELIAQPGAPHDRIDSMERFVRSGQRWSARLSALVAAVVLVVLVGGLALGLVLVRHNGGSSTGSGPNGSGPQNQQTGSSATPFSVTGVDLAVSPDSIAGKTCGSAVTFTYTATFHIPAGTGGGVIQFAYTLNNGRSSTSASVVVGAAKTTATYTFTSSGTLPADHTYPGIAEVMVTSPNAVHSPQVQPTGACVAGAAFKVTSVDMAVSPTSIAGKTCGTQITVTYTATFHIAPGGPGGTIQFQYTVNNGRGSTNASLKVAAGQTTATYSFTWSGTLPADHTYPAAGGVIVTSPNQITSSLVAPTGRCS